MRRPRIFSRFAAVLFPPAEESPAVADRLDKWLWAVRVYKTRPLATDACRNGQVEIGNQPAKPGRDVHPGEIVTVRQGLITRTLRVVGVPRSRVGAKLVPDFCVELTPPEEFERIREHRMQQLLARERGAGRPTKRERREIDRFLG